MALIFLCRVPGELSLNMCTSMPGYFLFEKMYQDFLCEILWILLDNFKPCIFSKKAHLEWMFLAWVRNELFCMYAQREPKIPSDLVLSTKEICALEDMFRYAYHPRTQAFVAWGSEIQAQFWLSSKVVACLGFPKLFLKTILKLC